MKLVSILFLFVFSTNALSIELRADLKQIYKQAKILESKISPVFKIPETDELAADELFFTVEVPAGTSNIDGTWTSPNVSS